MNTDKVQKIQELGILKNQQRKKENGCKGPVEMKELLPPRNVYVPLHRKVANFSKK